MTSRGEFRKKGASSRGMSDDSCPEDDDSAIPRHVTQERRPVSHDLSGWSGSPVTPYEISNQTDAKRKAQDKCAPKTARFKEDLLGLEASTQKGQLQDLKRTHADLLQAISNETYKDGPIESLDGGVTLPEGDLGVKLKRAQDMTKRGPNESFTEQQQKVVSSRIPYATRVLKEDARSKPQKGLKLSSVSSNSKKESSEQSDIGLPQLIVSSPRPAVPFPTQSPYRKSKVIQEKRKGVTEESHVVAVQSSSMDSSDLVNPFLKNDRYMFKPLPASHFQGKDKTESALRKHLQARDQQPEGKVFVQSVHGNFYAQDTAIASNLSVLRARHTNLTEKERALRPQVTEGLKMQFLSPVRDLLKDARRQVQEFDEQRDAEPKRSVSQLQGPITSSMVEKPLYRSKTNLGTYTDMQCTERTNRMTKMGDKTDRSVDPAQFLEDEDAKRREDLTRPDNLAGQVSTMSERPMFFKLGDLKDPVQAFRERERRFKRDGTLRDRLGRSENEAAIRAKMRYIHAQNFHALDVQQPLNRESIRNKVSDVPKEMLRAISLLESTTTQPLSFHVPPMTPEMTLKMTFDRLTKGMSSHDAKLLAGRDNCVLPKVDRTMPEGTMDTTQLPTKQMFEAHGKMLHDQVTRLTKAGVHDWQDSENHKLSELRMQSWDAVQQWEERLASLPRIKKGFKDLWVSGENATLNWTADLVRDGEIIQAVLRTGIGERGASVLNMPQIRTFHMSSLTMRSIFPSEMRRAKIKYLLQYLEEQKVALMEYLQRQSKAPNRSSSNRKKGSQEAADDSGTTAESPAADAASSTNSGNESEAATPIRSTATSTARTEVLPQQPSDEEPTAAGPENLKAIIEMRDKLNDKIALLKLDIESQTEFKDSILTEQNEVFEELKIRVQQLNQDIAKLQMKFEFRNEESVNCERNSPDEIVSKIIQSVVSLDEILNVEEECIDLVMAEDIKQKAINAARIAKEGVDDLKQKMNYMIQKNAGEIGRFACMMIVSTIAKICVEPDNEEARTIHSSSRSSPIHSILACRGGHDVLTALDFTQGNNSWSVSADVDTKKMQIGCEHLCTLLGIPDQIVLLKVQMQSGSGSVASDLLKMMMTSVDATNADKSKDAHQRDEEKINFSNGGELCDDGPGEDSVHEEEESAQEKALTQLFNKLDKDGGGSLSVEEMKIALHEFNIDEDRASVVALLEEVESHGDAGMGLDAFKENMIKLLTEAEVEPDIFEGMEEEQIARLKGILKQMVNGALAAQWDNWKIYADNQQLARSGALDSYRRVSTSLAVSPSISTTFRRFLQSRADKEIDLSNRGLSPLAFKAFVCGMYGWAPDFAKIEKNGVLPKDYVLQHPDETFAVPCEPFVNVFEVRKNGACVALSMLNLSMNAGGPDCARDLKHLLINTFGCLTHFNLSDNKIDEKGALWIAEALAHEKGPPLVRLELARNKMGDNGTAEVIKAITDSARARTLTYLDINGNECGEKAAVEMGKYLNDSVCSLLHLDMGWNLIRNDASAVIFKGLAENQSLNYLNLSWNGLGVKACNELGEALKTCVLVELDINHCNISGAGALLLAHGLKRNKLLRKLVLDSNNLKQSGARAIVKASLASEAHIDATGNERILSMVNCNLQSIDVTTFNKAEPAGNYSLDLEDPYDRSTFMELLGIAYQKRGFFATNPAPRIHVDRDKDPPEWKDHSIIIPDHDNEDEWVLPLTGVIEFTFASLLSSDNTSVIDAKEIEWLHKELTTAGKTERDRLGAIMAFCEGDNFLRFEQVEEIINILPEDSRSAERCQLVINCFCRLTEPERAVDMLELLVVSERRFVERKIGLAVIKFTKNNATGKYRLDLSKKAEREVCMRLIEINNDQQALLRRMDSYYSSLKGGVRPALERTWRNATFDDQVHTFSSTWAVPQKGFLEVDFVQITKPMSDEKLTSVEDFDKVLERIGLSVTSEEKLDVIKTWLNRNVCKCEQIEDIVQLGIFKKEKDRVELLITAFARVLDWHGYTNLLSLMSPMEFKLLVRRLGFINLFDEVMAVGYHELDLSIPDHRWVMQVLFHLAAVEPGNNMIDFQYNGQSFDGPPAGWATDVPKKNHVMFYYCRDLRVMEKVVNCGSWDSDQYPYAVAGKLPHLHRTDYVVWTLKDFTEAGMPQPVGTAWVNKIRFRRVKMKMLECLEEKNMPKKATEMFSLLDDDGGGELDSGELGKGFLRLGIWLQPDDLKAFVNELDGDGGGSIDLKEFSAWWEATPILKPTKKSAVQIHQEGPAPINSESDDKLIPETDSKNFEKENSRKIFEETFSKFASHSTLSKELVLGKKELFLALEDLGLSVSEQEDNDVLQAMFVYMDTGNGCIEFEEFETAVYKLISGRNVGE